MKKEKKSSKTPEAIDLSAIKFPDDFLCEFFGSPLVAQTKLLLKVSERFRGLSAEFFELGSEASGDDDIDPVSHMVETVKSVERARVFEVVARLCSDLARRGVERAEKLNTHRKDLIESGRIISLN